MKTRTNISNALLSVRSRLGLTQVQIAQYLGVSKSMVKLVETNRRFLTTDKLVKMAAVEIQLAVASQNEVKELPAAVRNLVAHAGSGYSTQDDYHRQYCLQRAARLEKKLHKMEMDYAGIIASLCNLEALKKAKLDMSDPLMRPFLLAEPMLLKKLSKCNPKVPEAARKKIAQLRAEASLIKVEHPRNVYTNENPIISPQKQALMDYGE